MSDEEVIIHNYNGIGDEYKELMLTIRACDSLKSFEELYDELIYHETNLKWEQKKMRSTIIAQFN